MKSGNKHGQHWITDVRRLAIYLRDGMACIYCGKTVEQKAQLTLDHIRPRCRGGGNESHNLVTACIQCNAKRGSRAFAPFVRERGICPARLRQSCRRKPHTDIAKEMMLLRGNLSAAMEVTE